MDTPYRDPKVSCNFHEHHCFSTTKMSSNWDNNDVFNTYDWLGDTTTTSHVCNQHDAFIDFQSENPKVKGVANLKAMAQGRGTITVQAITDGQKTNCTLKNVLYIPSNQTNLFSLGSWETNGNYFEAKNNILSLKQKDGQTIIKGKKLKPNLYHFNLQIIKPKNEINIVQEKKISWTTWHLQYRLQKLVDKKLVNSLEVDENSTKPVCKACTEAKMQISTFPKQAEN